MPAEVGTWGGGDLIHILHDYIVSKNHNESANYVRELLWEEHVVIFLKFYCSNYFRAALKNIKFALSFRLWCLFADACEYSSALCCL